jgi:hypothetical protein
VDLSLRDERRGLGVVVRCVVLFEGSEVTTATDGTGCSTCSTGAITFAAPLLKSTMFHHSEGALGTNRAVSVNQAYEHVLVRM